MENDSSGFGETSTTTLPPSDPSKPALKRPTGVKSSLGYVKKPKRFTGLKVLAFVIVIGLGILAVRMLAVPGGGPLMDLYRFFTGGAG